MTIHYINENIFDSKAEAIVNPVNCVGVMGAGLALRFKEKFPANFKEYQKVCKAKELVIGGLFIVEQNTDPKYVINFPTKDHWKDKSNLNDIRLGLKTLRNEIISEKIKSVAIPALGCGLGGLNWEDVKILIEEELKDIDAQIFIHEPI
jgi:O-acetyl-ADP-ribose deacetylase (regulator of RNase III)